VKTKKMEEMAKIGVQDNQKQNQEQEKGNKVN
jgi:hypothetical protein